MAGLLLPDRSKWGHRGNLVCRDAEADDDKTSLRVIPVVRVTVSSSLEGNLSFDRLVRLCATIRGEE